MTITDKQGNTYIFEPIEIKKENFESHLIKVNLNEDGSPNGEGVWASVHLDDYQDHVDDKKDGFFIARLLNNALIFFPFPSWGMYILCKHNGENRPICNINWVDYESDNSIPADEDTTDDFWPPIS